MDAKCQEAVDAKCQEAVDAKCQEAVDAKANERAATLAILERMTITGALVTVDAIATNPATAEAILAKGADYRLALKRNQPSLHDEVAALFCDLAPPASPLTRPSTRTTGASRRAPARSPPRSVGWPAAAAFPANAPYPGSRASSEA